MNKLRIVEKNFSQLEDHKDSRWDSEYHTFTPFVSEHFPYTKIANVLKNAQYGASIAMNEIGEGSPIYRMNELHNMLADTDTEKYAPIEEEKLSKFLLNEGDILFNRTNSGDFVGRTGIYLPSKTEPRDKVFASYLVRYVVDEDLVLPEYLAAFLTSKYGHDDVIRRSRPSINQTNVNSEEVKDIDLPLLPRELQQKIKMLFRYGSSKRRVAERSMRNAVSIIDKTVGYDRSFMHKNDLYCAIEEVSASNSIFNSKNNRIDAEYFQPIYNKLYDEIKQNVGIGTIATELKIHDRNFTPETNVLYQYVEISDISSIGTFNSATEELGNLLPTRARRKIHTGQVLVPSVEGSLKNCALVDQSMDNSLCSTGFYVVSSEKYSSHTLLAIFKSGAVQAFMKQSCSGTILTSMRKEDFRSTPFPKIPVAIQELTDIEVARCLTADAYSKLALLTAVKVVEIALEQGKEAADSVFDNFIEAVKQNMISKY